MRFQEKLYEWLTGYMAEHHRSPVYAEMTAAMGISPRSKSLITRALKSLERDRRIRLKKIGRTVEIQLRESGIPILGRISAGLPIEAIPDERHLDLGDWFNEADCFALQVKGNSMIDEGILDGDIVVCRQAQTAPEGCIVVALIDEQQVTLKRISYKQRGMATLIPANIELVPQVYALKRVSIQGVYVGLIRLSSGSLTMC